MTNSPFAALHQDLTDHITGLPRYASALVEIPHLARQQAPERSLGAVVCSVAPDPGLYRLTPEAAQRLRADITERLRGFLLPKDRLYSLSHWEWLAVLPELPSSAPLLLAMMKLQAGFADPLPTLDGRLALRLVCGGALWPDDGEDALHLVQSARIARLLADRRGEGHAVYDRSMEVADARQRSLHGDLQQALAGSAGLALHLQPQLDLKRGTCPACEALLRWQRPDGEWVPPAQTLAAVERMGLRNTFNRWLLQQTMQIQRQMAEAGIDIVTSINLSASDLLDAELPDLVGQSLATWEVTPDRLLLELTETVMVEQTQQVVDVLQRLRDLGLRLSIDDFGTGYAGMSYLQRLPVQEVKIDRSFICLAEESKKDREIIAAVVKLAHRLRMTVIAEGVETAGIADAVRSLGCDRAQGYLYAPALAVDDFIAWWRDHQARLPKRPSESARRRGRPRRPPSL